MKIMSDSDTAAMIWKENEVSESYLGCSMYEEAASLASLANATSIATQDMLESTAMDTRNSESTQTIFYFSKSYSCSSSSYWIYDSQESELKLNDIFEFVDILTSDLELKEENEDNVFL